MITTWVLIVFFHVGAMGNGNSNTTAVVDGFIFEQECKVAGNQAVGLTNGTVKEGNFVCVKQTKNGGK